MKVTLEIEVAKEDGRRVDPEDIASALADELDGFGFEAQHPDADDATTYVVTSAMPVWA